MRIGRFILKTFIIAIFIAFIVFHIDMMKKLSDSEKEEYRQNNVFEFKETAYGEGRCVTRATIEEYVIVDGIVISDSYEYIDVSNYNDGQVRYNYNIGDEIYNGDAIAVADNNYLKSPCNGIIEDIVKGDYVKVRNIDKIKLVCKGDRKSIDKIKNGRNLHLENGEKLVIDRVSNVAVDNMMEVVINVESTDFMYGQTFTKLKVFTGTVYEDSLVIDKECVYQKYENGPYFVRVLNDRLFFEYELQVEVGFETDEYISIVNVEEGTICDAGYKELIDTKAGME